MKKFKTSILFGLLSIVLAACVGTGSEANKAPAVALTNQYKVKSLSVFVSKSVSLNELPRFANEPKEKTAENIKSYVNAAMKKHVVPAFIGAKSVNIEAEVTHVQFATNGGVIIMQAASYMSGTATMKDAKTGTVIKTGNISITDAPVRGNGLGIIVAIAANATTTPEKRYTSMTEKFAKEALLQLK